MKFTFIHYTEGWHTGPTVELSTIPPLGTLVKAGDDSVESFFDIYYVDNVLLADGCTNYLFVRPFEGYGVRAPLTEADRITEAIKDLTEAVDNFDDNMHHHIGSSHHRVVAHSLRHYRIAQSHTRSFALHDNPRP